MSERTASILKEVGNPNKARIIAHLTRHRGERAEDLGKHLGYPLPTVYKYLRELEAARVVRSEVKNKTRLYYPGDFSLEVSPKKLMEIYEERSILNLYKARFGDGGMRRFSQVAEKVNTGKMTYRQAASTLGITYYEFVVLLDETGATQ